jgi:Xaa-Pro aminopeptidase
MDHPLRRGRLVARLPERTIDALAVGDLANVRYLSGFTGSNGMVVVGQVGSVFLTDGRYEQQSRHEVPDLERLTSRDGFVAPLRDACRSLGVARLGFEAKHLTVARWRELESGLEGVELVPTEGEVEELRWTKDAEELRMLEQAQEATDQAFDAILDTLALGMTERQVAHELDTEMRRAGADAPAFDSIVAFGENAAEPHHEPGHRVLEEGDVVKLDFGALWDGYHADMTRTIAFGAPPPELRKVHDIVREAQQAAIDAVREGVVAAEIDRAARTVIEHAGYGEAFSHGLGHGVGLQIHEGPWFHPSSNDVLPAGAMMTVEPGVYLPGVGGVRVEDIVEVTAGGCRVIPTATRELVEL